MGRVFPELSYHTTPGSLLSVGKVFKVHVASVHLSFEVLGVRLLEALASSLARFCLRWPRTRAPRAQPQN